MDRGNLVGQIRFQLSRLKSLNKHHEFERLALAFARARVAPNLIPATGPVGAGGDQGRDFESFRTSMRALPISGAFAAAGTDEDIVGLCTLQSTNTLTRKVKSDLVKVFTRQPSPTRVLYFCAEDLPVAKRHLLEDHCRDAYSATLTIFDGEALSDHLADKDIFWIAVEYLEIAAESYPDDYIDEEYQRVRDKWLVANGHVRNYADFVEVKRGLRTSMSEDAVKGDLSLWIDVMRRLIDNAYPVDLAQRARYEICVGELRGHGSLDPALTRLEEFLEVTGVGTSPNGLSDAAVLLVYAWGASQIGQASIPSAYIIMHRDRLRSFVEATLGQTTLNVERCTLLEALAMLSATATAIAGPNESTRAEELRTWRALVDEARGTPLYPIEHLGGIMELMTLSQGSNREFRDLAADVDLLISERTGRHDSGDRARRRALIHIEAGDRLAAIDELQKVKIAYYSGESVIGAILTMLLLSEQYEQLRLHIAARYVAACALFLCVREERLFEYLSPAAFSVSNSFYSAGEGMTSLYAVGDALKAHAATTTESGDWEQHEYVKIGIYHAGVYRAVTSRLAPELIPLIDSALTTWPLPESEIKSFKEFSQDIFDGAEAEIELRLEEELGVSLYLDVGRRDRYEWTALGLHWIVTHGPTHDDRFAALGIVSTLQILQADLADSELLLVPSDVTLRLQRSGITKPVIKPVPGNTGLAWNVTIPASYEERDVLKSGAHVMAVAVAALRSTSVMKSRDWESLIRKRVKAGLPGRALFIRPPGELLAGIQPQLPPELASLTPPVLSPSARLESSPEMGAPASPGPGYSSKKARKFIIKRYEFLPRSIKLTLPRLLSDDRARRLIAGMRQSGLLDWHILLIVANIVVQWQVQRVTGAPTSDKALAAVASAGIERMMRDERETDAEFDVLAFTKQMISAQEKTIIMLALEQWGLENHRANPDFDAIKALLTRRYGFLSDDVEHEDFLYWGSS